MSSQLFSPIELRSVQLRNRVVISPMCQYSAEDGVANDWHIVHLGRFALGGAGGVFVEATAVSREGRITPGCVGLWDDKQIAPLARVAAFLKGQGAMPGIQLAHAGRKASRPRPWQSGELPETGPEAAWPVVGPSAVAYDGWQVPTALDDAGLDRLRNNWREAVRRAIAAGFEMVEVHCAHGYLLHEFLSPLSNQRNDRYGGDRDGRMRFPLEIIGIVRETWPQDKPVFVRVSAVEWVDNGWSIEDTVAFARELKAIGVDVVDCSSGGNVPIPPTKFGPGYQVPFADRVRNATGIKTMAVGLITEPHQAEAIIAQGRADLVAIAREALANPQWALHAAHVLDAELANFENWPRQARWGLTARDKMRRMSA